MRHLFIKALLLSFFIHLIALNAFVFTFPVFPESFRPMFIFLGSVLKQQDVHGDVGWSKEPKEIDSFDNSQAKVGPEMAGLFVAPQAQTPRPFFREGEGKPVFSSSAGIQEKVTLKSTFAISAPDANPQAGAAGDDLTGYEVGTYKPLRLLH